MLLPAGCWLPSSFLAPHVVAWRPRPVALTLRCRAFFKPFFLSSVLLLLQFRDNILAIINAMEAMGGVMAQMPQLPVRCAGLAPRVGLGCGRAWSGGVACNKRQPRSFGRRAAALTAASPRLGSCPPNRRLNVDLANNFLPSRPASVPAYNLAMPPPQPALNAPGMVPC